MAVNLVAFPYGIKKKPKYAKQQTNCDYYRLSHGFFSPFISFARHAPLQK